MPLDFFISYTTGDTIWAEWIGWVLESEEYTVKLQAWDFAPGSNFILEMHRAATEARRTIAVTSSDYLTSEYGASEWAAAFSTDPTGLGRRLVPVRVGECPIQGLLRAVVYIDLVATDESEARRRLLQGLSGRRTKPVQKPSFPGVRMPAQAKHRPEFPGRDHVALDSSETASAGYMPNIRRVPSDLDRRRFAQNAFDMVARHFENSLTALSVRYQGVDYDLTRVGPTKFTAEVFVDGKSQQRCKIWFGTMLSNDGIAYSESDWAGSDNSYNELLTPARDGLALVATMSMAAGREAEGLNVQQLTPEDAAEYLWRRFASRIT